MIKAKTDFRKRLSISLSRVFLSDLFEVSLIVFSDVVCPGFVANLVRLDIDEQ